MTPKPRFRGLPDSDGSTVITNTLYYGERVVRQNISVRDSQGNVKTTGVLGGKILP
jgi:hypothetical protein